MSKPNLAHLLTRRAPALVGQPCPWCPGGTIVELDVDAHGAPDFGCLACGRPPGSPRPHEEPVPRFGEERHLANQIAKANAYWAQQAAAS
jgi:hypothetical protein